MDSFGDGGVLGVRFQWTKRPQNFCPSCGYSWYPRGKDRSAKCPSCGSSEVELAFEALLRNLGYFIAACSYYLELLVQWLVRTAVWLARLAWVGAGDFTEASAPVGYKALAWAVAGAGKCLGYVRFPFLWVWSVKDDLLAKGDRDVNPVGLIVKLLIIVVSLAAAIIWGIETIRDIRRT